MTPTPWKGFGRRFFGEANPRSQLAVCQHCHRLGPLQSYDTQLWFGFFFLPLIPLGGKRVLDECPRCGQHIMLSRVEWDRRKRDLLEQALRQMKEQPQNPDAAMAVHTALAAAGQAAEAEQMLSLLAQRFPHHANVQAYLGSAHDSAGQTRQAHACYEAAFQLLPQTPQAKAAVGHFLIRQSRFDDARQLLATETPPQNAAAATLFPLAEACQKGGRHKEALELFRVLAERLPLLRHDREFLEAVRESETALGQPASQLPPLPRTFRPQLRWGLVGGLVVVAVLGSNYYLSRHRTLQVVNGYDSPLTVQVSGQSMTLPPKNQRPIVLAEGRHQAVVRGAADRSIDFVIPGGVRERWLGGRDCFLNPGGAALLIQEETYHGAATNQAAGLGSFQLLYGQEFLVLPKADYLFSDFPKEIRSRSRGLKGPKRRIDMVRSPFANVFYWLADANKFEQALGVAEWHLRQHPEDVELLPAYTGVAVLAGRAAQARDFLAQGTGRRPVDIQWHRFYQEMQIAAGGYGALLQEYNALLDKAQEDSALLYLRGRLSANRREALAFYQRAIASDATNAFAQHALGYSYASLGEWAEARPHFLKASQLRPEDEPMRDWLFTSRLALGELAALETELQNSVQRDPLQFGDTLRLCEVLIAQGKTEPLQAILRNHAEQALRRFPHEGSQVHNRLLASVFYAQGAFAELARLMSASNSPEAALYRFQALVELGQLTAALPLVSPDSPELEEPVQVLAVSLALENGGLAQPAAQWREAALARMKNGRPEHQQAAALLQRASPIPLVEVLDLSLAPSDKAVVLLGLAKADPQQADAFRQAARRLNVRRQFPYHLVNRLTQTGPTP